MLAVVQVPVLEKTYQVICEDEEEIGSYRLKLRSDTHGGSQVAVEYEPILSYQCCKNPTDYNCMTGYMGYLMVTFCTANIRNAPH